jgi:CRP-like cAMP-binding protein
MVLGKGEMLGEMAMFTADGKRTDTAICATDVELAAIDESAMWRVLQDSPEFGLYLIRRLVGRSVSANAAGSANRGGVASLAA